MTKKMEIKWLTEIREKERAYRTAKIRMPNQKNTPQVQTVSIGAYSDTLQFTRAISMPFESFGKKLYQTSITGKKHIVVLYTDDTPGIPPLHKSSRCYGYSVNKNEKDGLAVANLWTPFSCCATHIITFYFVEQFFTGSSNEV